MKNITSKLLVYALTNRLEVLSLLQMPQEQKNIVEECKALVEKLENKMKEENNCHFPRIESIAVDVTPLPQDGRFSLIDVTK